MLRQRNRNRKPGSTDHHVAIIAVDGGKSKDDSLLRNRKLDPLAHSEKTVPNKMSQVLRKQPLWLLLAIASGSCAAFNGVFAKLLVPPFRPGNTPRKRHGLIERLIFLERLPLSQHHGRAPLRKLFRSPPTTKLSSTSSALSSSV
jgi:hypothetical protein